MNHSTSSESLSRPRVRPSLVATAAIAVAAASAGVAACGPRDASRSGDSTVGASAASGAGASAVGVSASAASAEPAAMRTEGPAYVFACPDGFRFSARVRGDTATVTLPSQVLKLAAVRAASGAKYEGGGATFWTKGDSALLETADVKQSACGGRTASTPWDEARMLGIELRGIGQEPGWIVDVDDGQWLRYVGDYGSTRLFAEIDGPQRDSAAGTLTYAVKADGRDLRVEIRPGPCQDSMSGESFTHAMTVRVDERELTGCARTLPTDDLLGRYWKLVELDGKPAVGGRAAEGPRAPHLRLRAGGTQAVGATGCNSFRGRAELRGDALKLGPLASTRMACVDAAANRQERDYLRVLGAVDRAVIGGDTLSLFSAHRASARFVVVPLR